MNSTQSAQLPLRARQVVRAADKSGALDRGEFTMSAARRDVCERLGLGLSAKAAEKKDVKDAIKQAVKDALAALEEGGDASENDEDASAEEEEAEKEDAIASSDDEAPPVKRGNTSRSRTSTPRPKGTKSKARLSAKGVETIEDSDDEAARSSNGKKRASEPPSPARSESEMSSVYDEPPSKKRGRAGSSDKAKSKGKSTKKAKKDPNEGLSPDEARVADLKRIVVACGMRKQWTKELADAPTPKAQISHLLGLLQSLGMKGNPSMGKAKGIKQRRELAQELSDVKEFEAERGAERPRRTRGADGDGQRSVSASGAMAAVMDFFSDDDAD